MEMLKSQRVGATPYRLSWSLCVAIAGALLSDEGSISLSQFPDIRVCDGRTGVCSIGAVAAGAGLSELTEECRKADLQFG